MDTSSQRVLLHQALITYFDQEELRTLCFYLKVDYDTLRGEGKAGKARELVAYLERLGRTEELVQACARLRPKLREQLSGILDKQGVTLETLVANPGESNLQGEVKQTLAVLLQKITALESGMGGSPPANQDPHWNLEMAKAFAASGDWVSASPYYDKYIRHDPDNWQVHFLRAVAQGNSRAGHDSNLAALRACNEAIALAPENTDINFRARMHGYRGAALKRLNRLEEAESDLLLAQRWAREEYEITDIAYNLACVYAMTRRKEEMLQNLRLIVQYRQLKLMVRSKKEYFRNYWNDPDFQSLVGMAPISRD